MCTEIYTSIHVDIRRNVSGRQMLLESELEQSAKFLIVPFMVFFLFSGIFLFRQ